MNIRQLFSGGIELDVQTAHRRLRKSEKMDIAISTIEKELDQYVSDGLLLSRFSIRDPNDLSELKNFDNSSVLETFKKSRNPLQNVITGEKYTFDECNIIKYYKLVNPEFVYPGLNPIERSSKMPCVIFGCDAISFSKKDSDDQVKIYKNLISVISDCLVNLKIHPNNTICIPSGDGYYIIFHGLEDPLIVIKFSCAVQMKISEKLLALPLRMGIEIGTVFKILHKNNQVNAIGHSLNMCARAMSLGKEKHILVSKTFYEACASHSEEQNNFHDLGEHKVKHTKMHIYNYYKDSVGNNDSIIEENNLEEKSK